jgi:hypothetical protein
MGMEMFKLLPQHSKSPAAIAFVVGLPDGEKGTKKQVF